MSRKGDIVCDPPRPLLIASAGLIGTLMGIVSMSVIFTLVVPSSPTWPAAKHRHGMLKTEPEEPGVNRQYDPDEQAPPDPEILYAVIAAPLLFGQPGILPRPENRFNLPTSGRLRKHRNDRDHQHAETPGEKCAMQVNAFLAGKESRREEVEEPGKYEAEENRRQRANCIRSAPQ